MSLRLSDVSTLAAGIDRLARWLTRETPRSLSLSTLSALARLESEGPLRVSDLTQREALTQPGMTVLVNRLAEAGLAERVPDPTDRRAALVRVTDTGRALLADRRDARARVLRDRLVQLDEHDRDLLMAALPAIERLIATSETTTRKK
ncbi:MAG TPA: MarR family transcriptional regulator [Jatrophihabitans sp.]|nr:MarR family transcriptional regulator [Jatrophihabitans sp.]